MSGCDERSNTHEKNIVKLMRVFFRSFFHQFTRTVRVNFASFDFSSIKRAARITLQGFRKMQIKSKNHEFSQI